MFDRILTAAVVLMGIVNLGFAGWVLWDHQAAGEAIGYDFLTSLGASEFIVVYVGLVGAMGVQLILAPFRKDGQGWLRVGTLLFAGLVVGRLAGFVVVDVDPERALFGLDGTSMVGAVFETGAAVVCALAARRWVSKN